MLNWNHYLPGIPEKEEMMKCKFCKAPMEKGQTVCPACGKEMERAKCGRARTVIKIAAVSLAGLVLLASLSAVVYCGVIGVDSFDEGVAAIKALVAPKENDVFYRDSYTVSDKKAMSKRETVVATVGDRELTNGELQVCYWMNVYDYLNNYGYYATYAGLDYTSPLDEQSCIMIDGTWQQYFLKDTLENWHAYQSMALMAEEAGLELADMLQENLDSLRETLTQTAAENGFESLDAMIQKDMGPGCTFDDYFSYMQIYYLGYMYYSDCYSKLDITEEMIEAYFTEHESELADSGITKDSGDLVDVRHVLIQPEGGTVNDDDTVTYTDEEWEACRAEAQALLDEWLAGGGTEAAFAEMAQAHSVDEGSNTNGGLYEDIYQGYMTDEFDAWCFEEGRTAGDYGLIKTEYGYHIMYFVDVEAQWHSECRGSVIAELANEIMSAAKEKYPMEADYKKIVLGEVDLSGE